MANPTPDFVQVQLTAKGQQQAGPHPLTVSNGRRTYSFLANLAQKVERSYEWKAWLSLIHAPTGEPIFEIVPEPPAVGVPATGIPAAPAASTGTAESLRVPATGTPAAPAPGTKVS